MSYNPQIKDGYIYLNGREDLDGSRRFAISQDSTYVAIEKRVDEIWQPASLEVSPNTILVGRRVGASGFGHHLGAQDTDGLYHFHAHSDFDGELSTSQAMMLDAYNYTERKILQSDDTGEYIGQSFGSNFYAVTSVLTKKRYFKTGSTVPTTPVTIKVYEGINDTGLLIFDQTYSASLFPASSEIELLMDGWFETDAGSTYYLKITCDTDFSIKTNSGGTAPWVAVDDIDIREDNMLQVKPWKTGDTFTVDQWIIDSKQIYVCNTAGVQTGTFASNSDKWDLLGYHINKTELDLITDGDHDVRTDNPHSVNKTDVGLSNVPNLDTTDAVNNEHIQNTDTILKKDGGTELFNAGYLKTNLLVDDTINIQIDEIRARDGDGLKLYDDGGNGIFIKDGGNIGIGTDTPGAKLDVQGSVIGTVGNNVYGTRFSTDFTEAVSGNHGLIAHIRLEVPTITEGDATLINTANLYVAGAMAGTVTGQNYALWVDSGISRFDGNVGIGGVGNPTETLQVNGQARVDRIILDRGGVQDPYIEKGSAGSNKGIGFYINAIEKMCVLENGNVGIGITNPLAKLHVVGDAIITTNLTVDTVIADNISSSDFVINDGTRDRILAGTIASYMYSPDGTMRFQVFDSSMGLVNGSISQVEVADSGTYLRSHDTSNMLVVNDTKTEITGILDVTSYISADGYILAGGKLQSNSTDDGEILLQFETPRRWVFQQEGSGSAASLRLRNLLGINKTFSIDTSGITQWRTHDGASTAMTINHSTGALWASTINGLTLASTGITYPTSFEVTDATKQRIEINSAGTYLYDEPTTGGGALTLDSKNLSFNDGTRNRIWADDTDTSLFSPSGDLHVEVTDVDVLIKDSARIRIAVVDSGNVGLYSPNGETVLTVSDNNVYISSTTGGFIVPNMTTSHRDALTPSNGTIIYNISTNVFNFYENGSWVTK